MKQRKAKPVIDMSQAIVSSQIFNGATFAHQIAEDLQPPVEISLGLVITSPFDNDAASAAVARDMQARGETHAKILAVGQISVVYHGDTVGMRKVTL